MSAGRGAPAAGSDVLAPPESVQWALGSKQRVAMVRSPA